MSLMNKIKSKIESVAKRIKWCFDIKSICIGIDSNTRLYAQLGFETSTNTEIANALCKVIEDFVSDCRTEMKCYLDDIQRHILKIERTVRTNVVSTDDSVEMTYETTITETDNSPPSTPIKYCNIVERAITTESFDEDDDLIERVITTRLGFEIEDVNTFWSAMRSLSLRATPSFVRIDLLANSINTIYEQYNVSHTDRARWHILVKSYYYLAIYWYASIDELLTHRGFVYPYRWTYYIRSR